MSDGRSILVSKPAIDWTESSLQISSVVREHLEAHFPGAFSETRYARLFQELLFPAQRDEYSGDPVMSRARLAQLEGRLADHQNHRYRGKQYLEAFEQITGLQLRI